MSDAENLEIFGKCNNPNGHGHNYTGECIKQLYSILTVLVCILIAKFIFTEYKDWRCNFDLKIKL